MPQLPSGAAFPGFVRGARLRANMTQDELAQAVRKSRRWVHDLETGKVDPSLGAVIDVVAVLGFTMSLEPSERSGVLDEMSRTSDGRRSGSLARRAVRRQAHARRDRPGRVPLRRALSPDAFEAAIAEVPEGMATG